MSFELPKFRKGNTVLLRGEKCVIEKIHQTPIGFMYDLIGKVGAYHESELSNVAS